MSLPRPLENNNQHNLNLSESCPVQADHLNVLEHEASAIQKKHYNSEDSETLNRLKLSITSIAELIEKGARILPEGNSEEVNKLFPDYSQLSIIESSIRQIVEGARKDGS